MTENVHKLTGAPLPGDTNADLIEALEGLLDRARKGEIQNLAWAGYTNPDNDTILNGWEGMAFSTFHLSASISMLHNRYHQQLGEE